jgi:type IV secretory pathway protease TraF
LSDFERFLRLTRLQQAAGLPLRHWLPSLIIPGWIFFATGYRWIGRTVMAAYATAAFLFLALLGTSFANVLFGLMLGAHAISILWLIQHALGRVSFGVRLAASGTILYALSSLVYWPTLSELERSLFMPLQTPRGVIVVKPSPAPSVRRGDTIIYRIQADRDGGVIIEAGYGIDRVLALPGDRIEFTREGLHVNGQWIMRHLAMPASGSRTIPQNCWYVWPSFDIQSRGTVPAQMTTQGYLAAALVPQSEYVGKPFRHWFGRRQHLP